MESLYKRNKNGSIQFWSVEEAENGYSTDFGQLNGKIQNEFRPINIGKQGRSIAEQAKFEARALHKNKRDEGYKSLEELGIFKTEGGYNCIEDQRVNDLETYLYALLPTENTDSRGYLKVMLSQAIRKTNKGITKEYWNKIQYPVALEPKLDGVRCTIQINNSSSNGLFQDKIISLSRESMDYNFGTSKIREKLEPIFEKYPTLILDGELYKHGMPQSEISGAMRSKGGGQYKHIFDTIEYHVYDIVNSSIYFGARRKFLELLLEEFPDTFILNPLKVTNTKEELDIYEEEIVNKGYEGIMAKNLDGLYKPNVRSWDSLKIKRFEDAEFKIVGFELGTRGVQDLIFILEHPKDKESTFKAVATGTKAQKEELWVDLELDIKQVRISNKYIGKKATVKFKEYNQYGTPIHAHVKTILV